MASDTKAAAFKIPSLDTTALTGISEREKDNQTSTQASTEAPCEFQASAFYTSRKANDKYIIPGLAQEDNEEKEQLSK